MRKLASVQIIKSVESIENADFIELVHVLGWQCVAKKGEFKPGDYCVYFEIDSFLPIREEFEFLRASSYKKNELVGEGFRLKTQTFRGQISQGMCLPMSILDDSGWHGLPEGTDVSDLLGVRKYEMPEMAMSGGNAIGELPGNVPHTDEIRIQAMPELLAEFEGKPYYISTKIDGSSHSISYDENGFHAMGHNYEYKDDGASGFYEFVKKLDMPAKLQAYAAENHLSNIVIQGEYAGPGIQKNRLKLKSPEWYVFDIRINEKRLHMLDFLSLAKTFGLTTVPIEEVAVNLPAHYPTIEALLARADGEYPNGGKKEGIVIRPTEPVYSATLGTDLSMKVVNNKYLLKHKD